MAKLPDVTKLYAKDKRAFEDLLSKAGTSLFSLSGKSPLSDPNHRKKRQDLRPKFEDMARQEGVTLAYVFTASDKPASQYCNPATGDVCSGRGMKPTWLKGYEAEYQVKAN